MNEPESLELTLTVAGVQPSVLIPGQYNAYGLVGESRRLESFDTWEEAEACAEAFAQAASDVLQRSRRLQAWQAPMPARKAQP